MTGVILPPNSTGISFFPYSLGKPSYRSSAASSAGSAPEFECVPDYLSNAQKSGSRASVSHLLKVKVAAVCTIKFTHNNHILSVVSGAFPPPFFRLCCCIFAVPPSLVAREISKKMCPCGLEFVPDEAEPEKPSPEGVSLVIGNRSLR